MEHTSLILVVDDQIRSQQALASLLAPEGYRVVCASSGVEALTLARQLSPDLVLLDVMMPEMDGFEVCRCLRSDPSLAFVPILMVTALDDTESLLRGLDAGADDFITKPFQRVTLRARIRTITRLNRFRALLDEQQRVTTERAQLLWAIEHASDGYFLLDEQEHLQYGNLQARRFLNLPADLAVLPDAPFLTLIRQQFQLEPADAWATWPLPTTALRYLVQHDDTASRWLTVELRDLPDGVQGNRLLRLCEVTAQIEAEQSLWTFHSFMSHKIRTPLTSVLGGMAMLRRRAPALLPNDLAMLFEIAYNGAQQLNVVVNDVFNYLNVAVVAPPGDGMPLAEVAELVRRLGNELTLTTLHVSEACDMAAHRLTVTSNTVELLLTEVLENAQKFHPTQTPTVHVSLGLADDTATIQVADDGQSLTPAQFDRLWEPYYQIDPTGAGQVPGLGLGMATVARVLWGVGGTCRAFNQPTGPGLIVELALPLGF